MAVSSIRKGLTQARLRVVMTVFFFSLAIPTSLLLSRAYSQMKWEVFHQYRTFARELATRIDADLIRLIETENARGFADYSFLVVAGDPSNSYLRPSPLSAVSGDGIPGLVGHFQLDDRGDLSSPLVPGPGIDAGAYGISDKDLDDRAAVRERVRALLAPPPEVAAAARADADFADQKLPSPASKVNAFARVQGFGRLDASASGEKRQVRQNMGRVADLGLDATLEQKSRAASASKQRKEALAKSSAADEVLAERFVGALSSNEPVQGEHANAVGAYLPSSPAVTSKRREKVAVYELAVVGSGESPSAVEVPQAPVAAGLNLPAPAQVQGVAARISFFESEIDALRFEILDDDHFTLFRNVWREGRRFVQGAVIDRRAFTRAAVAAAFHATSLASMSDLLVAYSGDVIDVFNAGGVAGRSYDAGAMRGALLYQTRFSSPLSELELIFTVTDLPGAPGGVFLAWVTATLTLVLCGGCLVIYRYGAKQISLYRQQQDFVSAVSHELKTPLTSIRMYSEMLRSGWAEEDKKKTYYAFIHDESERLSRLIANVLQLARLSRNGTQAEPKPVTVRELLDLVGSKISSQVEGAGFVLVTDHDDVALPVTIHADVDAFTQIMINLVDNAIKFSRDADDKTIVTGCRRQSDGTTRFWVRDHGPGIARNQMKKVFDLFYRTENELTRETVGTGIGLALVKQLASAMGASVDVRNCAPGVEFSLIFPAGV